MSCNRNYYFLDKSLLKVKMRTVMMIQKVKLRVLIKTNKTSKTSVLFVFLKTHEKMQHKLKCESSDFRTTSKILLRKHAKDFLACLANFPFNCPGHLVYCNLFAIFRVLYKGWNCHDILFVTARTIFREVQAL